MLFSDNLVKLSLGDLSDMGTPGPIPNPEVKHISADGTWRATSRESRSLPRGFFPPARGREPVERLVPFHLNLSNKPH